MIIIIVFVVNVSNGRASIFFSFGFWYFFQIKINRRLNEVDTTNDER